MVLEQLFQAQGTGISILLLLGLVLAFIVAFKIMEMVFETVVVSILSGTFYLALRYLQGGPIGINDVLMFSFLGASLYMMYSLLASLYRVGSTVIPLPYNIAKKLIRPFEAAWDKYEERQKRKSYVNRDQNSQDEEEESSGKSTKEVILGSKEDKDED
jgi:hypothetical protein